MQLLSNHEKKMTYHSPGVPTMVNHLVLVVCFAPITKKISKIWRVGAN